MPVTCRTRAATPSPGAARASTADGAEARSRRRHDAGTRCRRQAPRRTTRAALRTRGRRGGCQGRPLRPQPRVLHLHTGRTLARSPQTVLLPGAAGGDPRPPRARRRRRLAREQPRPRLRAGCAPRHPRPARGLRDRPCRRGSRRERGALAGGSDRAQRLPPRGRGGGGLPARVRSRAGSPRDRVRRPRAGAPAMARRRNTRRRRGRRPGDAALGAEHDDGAAPEGPRGSRSARPRGRDPRRRSFGARLPGSRGARPLRPRRLSRRLRDRAGPPQRPRPPLHRHPRRARPPPAGGRAARARLLPHPTADRRRCGVDPSALPDGVRADGNRGRRGERPARRHLGGSAGELAPRPSPSAGAGIRSLPDAARGPLRNHASVGRERRRSRWQRAR